MITLKENKEYGHYEKYRNGKYSGCFVCSKENFEKKCLIETFKQNQTLTNLQPLVNLGVRLKVLKDNQWKEVARYDLPVDEKRLIPLYNDKFEIDGLGIY